jgi:predicted nicotinamide N-methyase
MDRALLIQEQIWEAKGSDGRICTSGGRIWEAGQLLSDVLLSDAYREQLPAMRVLELGSGTGIGGLTAAAAGANVLLTDGDNGTLSLLEANVQRNVEANLFAQLPSVCRLQWGDARDLEEARASGPYDLIIGADIVYDPDAFDVLLESLEQLATPGRTEVLLTFGLRLQNLRKLGVTSGWPIGRTDELFLDLATKRNFELVAPVKMVKLALFAARLQMRHGE